MTWLSGSYRVLLDFQAALPHAQRRLELTRELFAPRSLEEAAALKWMAMMLTGLQDFPAALSALKQALQILTERGLAGGAEHASTLLTLGKLELSQSHYREALAVLGAAKDAMLNGRSPEYGVLINDMGICHKQLQQWSEALACYKEACSHVSRMHGTEHPEYATALRNLALLYIELELYAEAIPRLSSALAIRKKAYGDKHQLTLEVLANLEAAKARQQERDLSASSQSSWSGSVPWLIVVLALVGTWLLLARRRPSVSSRMPSALLQRLRSKAPDVERHRERLHNSARDAEPVRVPKEPRTCAACGATKSGLATCSGCLSVYYCDAACQLADWSRHKQQCSKKL